LCFDFRTLVKLASKPRKEREPGKNIVVQAGISNICLQREGKTISVTYVLGTMYTVLCIASNNAYYVNLKYCPIKEKGITDISILINVIGSYPPIYQTS